MIEFSYKNEHSRMLIVRCIGENSFYVEKVVLPSEIIAFEAPKDARVEIWGSDLSGVHIEHTLTVGDPVYLCYDKEVVEDMGESSWRKVW